MWKKYLQAHRDRVLLLVRCQEEGKGRGTDALKNKNHSLLFDAMWDQVIVTCVCLGIREKSL